MMQAFCAVGIKIAFHNGKYTIINNKIITDINFIQECEVSGGHDGKHPTFGYKFQCPLKRGIYTPLDKLSSDLRNGMVFVNIDLII